MALSSPYTLGQIRATVRRELLDPTGKWWSNDELDSYANDWNHTLQSQFEFAWGTATLTFTDTTTQFELTAIASDIMRLDAIYYSAGNEVPAAYYDSTSSYDTNMYYDGVEGFLISTGRLSPRTMADLDTFQRNWRGTAAAAGIDPIIVYQENAQTVSFWPPPAGTGTAYFEYPILATMATSTDTMVAPAWTRYSAVPYILYRAYARYGSTQNLGKASRRRKQWDNQLQLIRKFYDGYFPDKAEMLRPGRRWAGQVLRTKPAWPVWR